MNKTCMSYWLPKLEAAGLPTPRTKMLQMPRAAFEDIFRLFDGEPMQGAAQPFLDAVVAAATEIGFPVFLRTGLTSGKHSWEDTCYFSSPDRVVHHVASIVEFSEIVDFIGLSCEWWAIREFLPTMPITVCPSYSNMPVCREFRFFVDDGAVKCWHPYWPLEALEIGGAPDAESAVALLAQNDCVAELNTLAAKAGAAVGGAWSVDLIETQRGWFITDMAEASKSYHWPECSAVNGTVGR